MSNITAEISHVGCEREPIHLPGSIQPYGLLFVVDQTTDLILQAAGDAESLIGFSGCVLRRTLRDVIGTSLAELMDRLDVVFSREPVFLGVARLFGDRQEMVIVAHQVEDAAVVEVMPSASPGSAAKTLASVRSITARIGEASDIVEACELAASEVRRITGYDRVLAYQFLHDASGSVIAEANDGQLPRLLNHRFPASDIPAQARELYRRNAIRIIPDVGYTPALLDPPRCPTTQPPLDMSQCMLRSVSPVHIKYLRNMGVGASMSVSLFPSGGLWGLIAAHSAKPRAVPYEAQQLCRHVGEILSQYIRARQESQGHRLASDLSAVRDRVMGQLFAAEDPSALMRTLGPDLQAVVPSNGAAVVRNGTVMLAGSCPTERQVRDLSAWFELRTAATEFFATDRLADEYPPARAFTIEASGLLAIRLPGDDVVILMWFRAEQVQEIYWAGNPHDPLEVSNGLGALNPRKSFATWVEAVRGRSRPWDAVEIESAKMFNPRIAFVLQQKRVRELNALLTDANERLAALALQDGLTGIANRRAFDERLRAEWTRASRSKRPVALLILDVDFFKQYNDHYGHALGDTCLKQIAQVLGGSRRAADLAARIGGEEFSIILPDTSIEDAKLVAENVRERIEALELPHAKSASSVVTVSVGIAAGTADKFSSVEALLDAADKALYKAKSRGRNRSELSID